MAAHSARSGEPRSPRARRPAGVVSVVHGGFRQDGFVFSRGVGAGQRPWRGSSAKCLGTACYLLDETAQAWQQLEATIEVVRELVPLVALLAGRIAGALGLRAADSRRLHSARQMIEARPWRVQDDRRNELAGGLASEHHGDLAGAEMAMARSLVPYRRVQAPVEQANALLHLARLHVRQGHDAVSNDEFDEAAMLIRSCLDPGAEDPATALASPRACSHERA